MGHSSRLFPIVLRAEKFVAVCATVQQVEDITPPVPPEKEFGSYVEERCRQLPAREQSKARQMLQSPRQVFSHGKYDLGMADATKHEIPLTSNARPLKQRPYRHEPVQQEDIEQQVHELPSHGLIKEGHGAWSLPDVLV